MLIKVGVYHSRPCFYNGHMGVLPHKADELLASARYAQVYIAYGIEQRGRCFVAGRQQCHAVGCYVMLLQHPSYQLYGSTVRCVGIMSAFQQTDVSALQAECKYVEGNVGTCLVYDAYHAERHAHLAQQETVG